MKFPDEDTLPLQLLGGVVQAQVLHVPPEVVMNITSYRHACRMAWRVARLRHRITKRTLAELAGAVRVARHGVLLGSPEAEEP
jgi:hypothetical protein